MLNTKENTLIQIVDIEAYVCHRKILLHINHSQFNQN